jgi:hypothetical protein
MTTTLSYGNMRFSGTYENMRFSGTYAAETPQPIKMKFCTIYYVGELRDVPKTVGIGWLEAAPQRDEILPQKFSYYTLPYLTLQFFLVIVYSKNG